MVTALTSFTKFNTEPLDRIGVTGPLTFNKTAFNLAWTSKPTDTYYIQEYLPKNETAEHFNQMLSIFLLAADIKPSDAVQQKINELNDRKSPDKKEYMVDFVLGDSKTDVEEFNIYRYKQIDLGNKGKALLVYAYSKRAYGNAITPFLKNLKSDRTNLLNVMSTSEIPTIKIVDK